MEPDFSGWATKANLKCSDGRTITSDAFKHMDGQQVPLVWQHGHNDVSNVLGYAILKHLPEGVRADGYFNGTSKGQDAKALVQHQDIKALSIYANNLVQKSSSVTHGNIREVSLVLAGANPGAVIDFVSIRHGDGDVTDLDDEAVIFSGEELIHADATNADEGPTVQEIFDTLTPEQVDAVNVIVSAAVENAAASSTTDTTGTGATDAGAAAHSDKTDEGDLDHQEGNGTVTRNVFDQTKTDTDKDSLKHVLDDAGKAEIFSAWRKTGSMKEAVEDYALAHGITPMDILFPNAKLLSNTPQFNSRRMEWVAGVLNSVSHSPFSRVRTIVADITQDDARARGYIKGSFKKDEWFTVTKRETTPTTVYKKQSFDRDDVIDITDFDVVAWVKVEMDLMLKEELARAILIGDGRAIDDPDHIQDPLASTNGAGIRSILNEHELYKTDVFVNLDDASSNNLEATDAIVNAMRFYKGTGRPVMYTTWATLTSLLLTRDTLNRRLWTNKDDLASSLLVSDIIPVEVLESVPNLLAIIVNLADYNIGADRGGEVNMFDFFDIDYNKMKYLIETRISGALTKVKSALVVMKTASTDVLVVPTVPTFNKTTGVVTIPTKTGVVYKNAAGATLTAGAQTALTAGQSLVVHAVPASGYYFATDGTTVEWTFSMTPA